jgi:hypothetical protein
LKIDTKKITNLPDKFLFTTLFADQNTEAKVRSLLEP